MYVIHLDKKIRIDQNAQSGENRAIFRGFVV